MGVVWGVSVKILLVLIIMTGHSDLVSCSLVSQICEMPGKMTDVRLLFMALHFVHTMLPLLLHYIHIGWGPV